MIELQFFLFCFVHRFRSCRIGTETDQGEYIQRIIDSLPLDKLVIVWIQILTILQNPSECGDISVDQRDFDLQEENKTNVFLLGFSSNAEIR